MGKLWCDGFKTAYIRKGPAKRISLVTPYYENPQFLKKQVFGWDHEICGWEKYPESLRPYFRALAVDDGSKEYPIHKVVYPSPLLRLFRIGVDVRWNWLAARNIGAAHAEDGWILITDIDHVLPVETLEALVTGSHDENVVYCFRRKEHTGVEIAPHSASFFMTKKMFWRIGGYDEALSGYYGTDGVYRRELAKHAKIEIIPQYLVRHEHIGDSSTKKYKRKQPEDAAVKKIVAARTKSWKPRVLSYPYTEIVDVTHFED